MKTTLTQSPDVRQKLRYLRALEANAMNKSQTARELGIARSTLERYYQKYWNEYVKHKSSVFEDSQNIAAKKVLLEVDTQNITMRLQKSLATVLNVMTQRLQNDLESISFRDLIQLFSVLAPYVIEKKAVVGTKDNPQSENGSLMASHQAFVQKIINRMNASSENERNES